MHNTSTLNSAIIKCIIYTRAFHIVTPQNVFCGQMPNWHNVFKKQYTEIIGLSFTSQIMPLRHAVEWSYNSTEIHLFQLYVMASRVFYLFIYLH